MQPKMLAFHYDLKRAMWTREYMDRVARRLQGWGFNTIFYELEDKMEFRGHPAISHVDAWTQEQTADFARDCRARGIEVIPLVQTLGHAESVVGKPEYAHLREMPDVRDQYDPLSEPARDLLIDLIDQTIDVFQPGEYFHMGGDETRRLGESEKCRPVVEEIGTGGLYLKHMMPLFEHVRDRGLRPIIWADIVLAHPDVLDRIPRCVVLMDWLYNRCGERADTVRIWGRGVHSWEAFQALEDSPAKRLVEKYALDEQSAEDHKFRVFFCTDALCDLGFDVITASANRCAGDTMGIPQAMHLENVYHSARKGTAAGLGELVTCWAVRYNHPEVTMPGAFAGPWSLEHDAPDREACLRACTQDQFGVEMPELDRAWRLAEQRVFLSEGHSLKAASGILADGGDPVEQYLEDLRTNGGVSRLGRMPVPAEEPGDRVRAAIHGTESVRADYQKARAIVADLKGRAKRNAAILDYWIEGIDLLLFYADFALAALAGELPAKKDDLLDRLNALREKSRALFLETYSAGTTEEELLLRYGVHEALLTGNGDTIRSLTLMVQ